MIWTLRVKAVVRRQMRNLFPDKDQRADVWEELLSLEADPFPQGVKAIRGNWRAWRIAVGGAYRTKGNRGWRAIYTLNRRTGVLTLWRVEHRDVVYKHLPKRYNPGSR